MRIVLIGYAYSVWIKRFVEYVLLNRKNTTTIILDFGKGGGKYQDFYNENHVRIIRTTWNIPLIRRIPKIRCLTGTIYLKLLLMMNGGADIIHIQGIDQGACIAAMICASKKTKVIATYWGAEIQRVDEASILQTEKFFNRIDDITFIADSTYLRFKEVFHDKYNSKLFKCEFGTSGLEEIDSIQTKYGKSQTKEYFGLIGTSTVIAIGYCSREDQHHIEVLNQLLKIPKDKRANISLLFQMTYGNASKGYVDSIRKAAIASEIPFLLLDGDISDEDNFALRCATDIFIHAQNSDARSASITEFLYAGARVLNPKWIQYPEYLDWGVKLVEYKNMNDLPLLIVEMMNNCDDYMRSNHDILSKHLLSWKDAAKSWEKLYEVK